MNVKEDGLHSTMRSHYSSLDENGELTGQRQSPYQARRNLSGGRMRYEPVYLREILNTDSGYPSSTPVSIVAMDEPCEKRILVTNIKAQIKYKTHIKTGIRLYSQEIFKKRN